MGNKSLEKKFGLDLLLKTAEEKVEYCLHCRKSTNHYVLSPDWQRFFTDPDDSELELRQSFEFHKCVKCQMLKFLEMTWLYDLDEHEVQDTELGETVIHNMDRDADGLRCFPPILSTEQQLLLEELQKIFSKHERNFAEEVCTAIHAGMFMLAAVGIRSIIEKFYFKIGPDKKRDKFVAKAAKEAEKTSKVKNNYRYKLLWLEENGLITSSQNATLHSTIKLGNWAAHAMELPDNFVSDKKLINDAVKATLALALLYNQRVEPSSNQN